MKTTKRKRVRMKKGDDNGVKRLVDIETAEVSVVDRPANQRTFLIVKNEDGPGPQGEVEESDQGDPDLDSEPSTISRTLKSVMEIVQVLKCGVISSETGDSYLPQDSISTIGSIQMLLKTASGCLPGMTIIMPSPGSIDFSQINPSIKKSASRSLSEVERRLDVLKSELEDVEVLDPGQVSKVDAIADILGEIVRDGTDSKEVITSSSLDDAQRDQVIKGLTKSISDMTGVLACVMSSGKIGKSSKLADASVVGSVIHDASGSLDSMVAAFMGEGDRHTMLEKASEQLSVVRKSLTKAKLPEGADSILAKVEAPIQRMAKMVGMYTTRWCEDGVKVVWTWSDMTIATFDSWEEAEMEALRLNIEMILEMEKAEGKLVTKAGEKYAVVDVEKAEVVAEFDTEEAAKESIGEETTKAEDDSGDEESEEQGESPEGEDESEGDDPSEKEEEADVAKSDICSKMLNCITDVRGSIGSILSGEEGALAKFQSHTSELASVTKAHLAQQGIEDSRSSDTSEPNVGSGVQPADEDLSDSDGVVGEGTPEEVKALLKAEREKLAKAERRLSILRKRRRAPAAPPADAWGEEDHEDVELAKMERAKRVSWPRDMNDDI